MRLIRISIASKVSSNSSAFSFVSDMESAVLVDGVVVEVEEVGFFLLFLVEEDEFLTTAFGKRKPFAYALPSVPSQCRKKSQ